MAESFQQVEHVGIFSALMQSFRRVLGGGLLFILAFPWIFWNECSAVRVAKSLTEGAGAVVSVSADIVDPANEGKLIHISGTSATPEILTDPDFGFSLNAIKLSRDVEMYQWTEDTSTKSKGSKKTTTTTYETEWKDGLVRSSDFEEPAGHQNPSSIPYEDKTMIAQTVTVGAFSLNSTQLNSLVATETVLPEQTAYTRQDGWMYLGGDPSDPQVGDVRVQFTVLRPGPVSVVAQQTQSTFAPYPTSAGRDISMIESGNQPAEAMFQAAQDANAMWTWIIRFGAFLFIFIGLNLVLGPLKVVADRIPLLGGIFNAGLGLVTFIIAAGLSAVAIGAAWIVARPLLGIVLLTLSAGALVAAAGLILLASRAASKVS